MTAPIKCLRMKTTTDPRRTDPPCQIWLSLPTRRATIPLFPNLDRDHWVFYGSIGRE
ncbi:hypothetical protein SLEP1_g54106 [Rubroshorea leprosula]|uniref:Uncharacterized protein n=1 Tax=Rubroshorea leprosula TaxID=152421 RepID=A0AAV5MEA3_9ROSI|nr:hypothetical protein SLEP1_g54106 [Rubroshorea leprosula]